MITQLPIATAWKYRKNYSIEWWRRLVKSKTHTKNWSLLGISIPPHLHLWNGASLIETILFKILFVTKTAKETIMTTPKGKTKSRNELPLLQNHRSKIPENEETRNPLIKSVSDELGKRVTSTMTTKRECKQKDELWS